MAQLVVDGNQSLVFGETFPSQLLSASGNGVGVDLSSAIANEVMAILSVNTGTAFTSLSVAFQESPDNATWTNLINPETGSQYTLTILTVQTQAALALQLTVPATLAAAGHRYIRGVATLVGTSCQVYCDIVFQKRMGNTLSGYQNQPPTIS